MTACHAEIVDLADLFNSGRHIPGLATWSWEGKRPESDRFPLTPPRFAWLRSSDSRSDRQRRSGVRTRANLSKRVTVESAEARAWTPIGDGVADVGAAAAATSSSHIHLAAPVAVSAVAPAGAPTGGDSVPYGLAPVDEASSVRNNARLRARSSVG